MSSKFGEHSKPDGNSKAYVEANYWKNLEAEKKRKEKESKTKTS